MNTEIFLKQNSIRKENIKFAASESFLEGDKPALWEIRAITAAEDSEIKEKCLKRIYDESKRQYKNVFDGNKYAQMLCAASTVYPDLKNAELQNSYNVMGESEVLKEMLGAGEFERYLKKVQEINGYGKNMEELKEEAKN